MHIELDCKLVVDSIVESSINRSEFGNIMATCRALSYHFPNFKVSFVKSQANCVAHSLRRATKLYARHRIFDLNLSCIVLDYCDAAII